MTTPSRPIPRRRPRPIRVDDDPTINLHVAELAFVVSVSVRIDETDSHTFLRLDPDRHQLLPNPRADASPIAYLLFGRLGAGGWDVLPWHNKVHAQRFVVMAERDSRFSDQEGKENLVAPPMPPPGFYPDPLGSSDQRWWNGKEWAATTMPGRPRKGKQPVAQLIILYVILTAVGMSAWGFGLKDDKPCPLNYQCQPAVTNAFWLLWLLGIAIAGLGVGLGLKWNRDHRETARSDVAAELIALGLAFGLPILGAYQNSLF